MKRARTLSTLAVLFAAAGRLLAADAPTLPELIARFDGLTIGPARAAAGLRLTGPHALCVLESGRVAPVLAGGEVVGIFFAGSGSFEYTSVDPIEAPVVMFDAKKGSSLKPEKTEAGVRLRDSIKRLLWLARGQPLPELTGAAAASLEDAFRAERQKFGRIHAPPLSHDFAVQALDAPESPLVWAEIEGGREDLLYAYDAVDEPAEGLATVVRSESDETELRKYLWLAPLSLQPIGRDPRDPPRPRVSLTRVDLELTATAGNDARLTVVETLVPRGRAARALRLDLDSIVYAMAGTNLEARSERLTRVTDEKNRSLAFDHRLDEVVLALAEDAPPDRPVTLRFEIEGNFLVRPRGDNYWELGIWSWFPQPSLTGQEYTWHATVRVPKPFVPFMPGETVRRETDGGIEVLETRIDKPVSFAVILAGRYDMEEDVRDGVKIRVATYALDNPRARKQLTQVAAEIIAYYREFLGPFPFPEFNIIEINDYGYGQAPPATMFITKEAFDPLVGDMSRFEAQEIAKIFAHEIAHQWWGIVVRVPGPQEQWLAESFAEYCASLFIKDRRSPSVERALVKRWKRGANFAGDAAPISLANRVWVTSDARRRAEIRNGLLYDKGPLVLGALSREMGDAAFRKFLGSVQAAWAWKFGSTRELVRLLEPAFGKDPMPFFDKYYWGVEMPPD